MSRILFANIGWMVHYKGQTSSDTISGGGSYRNEDKHEAYNFLNLNGWCYGYVQPVKDGNINISRIDNCIKPSATKIDNVLVIWTARHPDIGGTYIVGWYKNATVFRESEESKNKKVNKYPYFIKAKAEDCTLLSPDERHFNVPRANPENIGFMGQSNVWYADKNIPIVIEFRNNVIKYIDNHSEKHNADHDKLRINVEAKKKVEEAAINVVTEHFKKRGFQVKSVEKENLGWDLEAFKDKLVLRIEVKGLADEQISVHLTRNEYSKMNSDDNSNYRLCVVTKALKEPNITTFLCDGGKWVCDDDEKLVLNFNEQVAAIAFVE